SIAGGPLVERLLRGDLIERGRGEAFGDCPFKPCVKRLEFFKPAFKVQTPGVLVGGPFGDLLEARKLGLESRSERADVLRPALRKSGRIDAVVVDKAREGRSADRRGSPTVLAVVGGRADELPCDGALSKLRDVLLEEFGRQPDREWPAGY